MLSLLSAKFAYQSFFAVLGSGLFLYTMSWFLAYRTQFQRTRIFAILSKHSMDIYLFHDPLNYVILFFAFTYNWLLRSWGCFLYVFLRTAGVVLVSLGQGQLPKYGKAWVRGTAL
jgi:hypothetical protein